MAKWLICYTETGHPTLEDALKVWHEIWDDYHAAEAVADNYVVGRLVDVRPLLRPDFVLPDSELR